MHWSEAFRHRKKTNPRASLTIIRFELYNSSLSLSLEGELSNNELPLKVEQVAEMLSVTPRTVRNLIKRGRFPGAYKLDPESTKSTYQIPYNDVENYLLRRASKF
jgi:predicted DNA-binding transcriptional regulator AlpA